MTPDRTQAELPLRAPPSYVMPNSLWAATAEIAPATPPLEGEADAEVVIVGGGYTGLSAALHLAEAGTRVRVLEACEPGWGASGRNGGHVIPGIKAEPDEIIATLGEERGRRLIEVVRRTADLVFELIERHAIRCDARRVGWLQPAHNVAGYEACARKVEQWVREGADVALLDRPTMAGLLGSEVYCGGWLDRRGGNLQPLSYARGLARAAQSKGAVVHGASPARKLTPTGERWRVDTPSGHVTADRVILATNGYTDDLWPGLKRSIVPVHSFQVATRPLSDNLRRTILPGGHAASDIRRMLRYFSVDRTGRLTMGGRAGGTDTNLPTAGNPVDRAVAEIFPQLGPIELEYSWIGRVAITTDFWPHLHELAPGLVAGLGYNGRGVGMATMMGKLLAKHARGRDVAFPVTRMRPIAFHGLHRAALPAVQVYYRLRDAIG